MTTPLFRWNGKYFGFVTDGNIYGARSTYLGWIEQGGVVWRHDGRFVGHLVQDNYILKNLARLDPTPRIPPSTPISPIAPAPALSRPGKIGKTGWNDALDDLMPG